MSIKTKVLIAILGALLALATASAPAWAAAQFESSLEHTLMVGAQGTSNAFKLGASTTSCETAALEGTTSTKTNTQLSMTPSYEGCHYGPFKAHVAATGCSYILKVAGKLKLECEGTKRVEITPTFLGSSLCTLKLAPGEYGSVSYENKESGGRKHLTVVYAVKSLSYEELAGGGCEVGSGSGGEYTGTDTLKGYSGAGVQGNLAWAKPETFDYGSGTTKLVGVGGEQVLNLGGNNVVCSEVAGETTEFNESEVKVTPNYPTGKCTAFGFPTHFPFAGRYVFTPNKTVDLTAAVHLTPTFLGSSVCTINLSAGTYKLTGYDNGATAPMKMTVTTSTGNEIPFEEEAGSCGAGSGNGSYTGNAVVEGQNAEGKQTDITWTE